MNEFDDEIQIVLNKFSNKIVYHTTKDKQEKIDDTDEEIIKIITNNARIPVSIIYLTNLTESRLHSFMNYASSLEGAIWLQRVMGSWDFELDFELESYDKFQDIILNLKEKFPDIIKNHEFCIVSKEFKLDLFPNCYREIKTLLKKFNPNG